ncbi:MAG TPA: AtpZ/AtpI family protein [Acidobacteriaceae bacterium]|nr:AtpZ/AtpI family protein [Acidobacteriaceae bacterium]
MNAPDKPESQAGRSSGGKSKDGALASLVRAESVIQLALLLPAATVIGWAIGAGLDHWLHQHWMEIAGLLLGAAAGFVQIFRVILALNKE